MLKTRVLTASVLLPLVILSILYLPSVYFAILSGFITLLGAWEWSHLVGFQSRLGRVACLLVMIFLSLILLIIIRHLQPWLGSKWLLGGLVLGFWCFALLIVCRYPKDQYVRSRWIGMCLGLGLFIPFWSLLNVLQHCNPKWVLYIMVLIWTADTGAYFSGKKWGKHLLAQAVSPGKTWEGVLGSMIATSLVAYGAYKLFHIEISLFLWLLLALVSVLFSIVRDLFESVFNGYRV